jgi:glycosyltransferase involved in cell wall biosynthesis
VTGLLPPRASTEPAPAAHDHPRPRVSLCVPAYQAERHLRATIDSLLAQRGVDFEVVIVNNNSSDATGDIAESYTDPRVRVVHNDTTVPVIANFNAAVAHSTGEYVKLVCADDLLQPDCIAAQAAVLDDDPAVALVGVQTDFLDDEGRLLRPARGLRGITGRRSAPHVVRRIVRSGTNPIGAPVAAMFRRADFLRCGGFRDDRVFVADVDLWTRLLAHGDFHGIARAHACFRFSSASVSSTMAVRSQHAQQAAFIRAVSADPRWQVSRSDCAVGRASALDKSLRRIVLFEISRRRDARVRPSA